MGKISDTLKKYFDVTYVSVMRKLIPVIGVTYGSVMRDLQRLRGDIGQVEIMSLSVKYVGLLGKQTFNRRVFLIENLEQYAARRPMAYFLRMKKKFYPNNGVTQAKKTDEFSPEIEAIEDIHMPPKFSKLSNLFNYAGGLQSELGENPAIIPAKNHDHHRGYYVLGGAGVLIAGLAVYGGLKHSPKKVDSNPPQSATEKAVIEANSNQDFSEDIADIKKQLESFDKRLQEMEKENRDTREIIENELANYKRLFDSNVEISNSVKLYGSLNTRIKELEQKSARTNSAQNPRNKTDPKQASATYERLNETLKQYERKLGALQGMSGALNKESPGVLAFRDDFSKYKADLMRALKEFDGSPELMGLEGQSTELYIRYFVFVDKL